MEVSFLALKAIIVLSVVLLIIYASLKLLQRYSKFGYTTNSDKDNSNSLRLENIAYIDEHTKVVSIKYSKHNRYLIAISKGGALLIDKIVDEE